jgi:hypothetical protein
VAEAATGVTAFLDAVLPECRRMVDVGAGLAGCSLLGAAAGVSVASVALTAGQAVRLEGRLGLMPGLARLVRVHDAAPAMDSLAALIGEIGLCPASVLRLGADAAGVVPGLAPLLARGRPFVVLEPGAMRGGDDPYRAQLEGVRGALALAATLAVYRHLYLWGPQGWAHVAREERLGFLTGYLMVPKLSDGTPARGGCGRYGFVGPVGVSEVALPLG